MINESTCTYHITRKGGARYSFIWMHTPIINYALKSEVAITLLFVAIYSTRYTSLQNVQETSLHESSCNGKWGQKANKAVVYTPIIHHTLKSNWGGHCTSFVAMLRSLHNVTNEQQCKKLLCNESRSLRKVLETKPVGSHIVLSQIKTLSCQQWELEYKGG